jgi:hypothetical protein
MKPYQKKLPDNIQGKEIFILYRNDIEKISLKKLFIECGFIESSNLLYHDHEYKSAVLLLNKKINIEGKSYKEGLLIANEILKFQSVRLWRMGRNLMGRPL